MWGEIDPCTKPAGPELYKIHQNACEPSNSCGSSQSNFIANGEDSSPLDAMISAIVVSGCPVKHQQLEEPALTVKEKKQLLMEQYNTNPVDFLERYHTHLKPEHLVAFSHVSNDHKTQRYYTEVQKRAKRARKRRYAALRVLEEEGQYFSDEQMRFREPLLYEQYIGQYLSDEERRQHFLESLPNGPICLHHLLLSVVQEKQLQNRIQEEYAKQEEEEDKAEEEEQEPTAEDKDMLREVFMIDMRHRFLNGKDKDFNYREVDENSDYDDDVDSLRRDEEKYFDEEEEDEEEEEADGGKKENEDKEENKCDNLA
ncbi:coiled-coil domain-containing protein 97 [Neoarius graeffei]|uniref:coiled-coil domain-containing protein 97 n=1 Tax=Neoarius graeffei TaxID=443677 RepID=UPI00298BF034|nr:coiled-coil domain-containing protein 97 [Neoarius graeffei]XP_060799003.1 coiled-coil domain-containing protein 97 [Neoarius graeffei]XP_060799004.1 coiled-coil domain-containing protein 97 [Neoarius graeffei]